MNKDSPLTFSVEFTILPDEWARTASMRWVNGEEPIGDLFEGTINVSIAGTNIFESEPYPISVSNVAVGLAHIYGELSQGANGDFSLYQIDDCLTISFFLRDEAVTVSYNGNPVRQWGTTRSTLIEGITAFLIEFCHDMELHIPDPYAWRELVHLKRWSLS